MAVSLGAAWAGGSGLYPYLKSFFPNGVQVVQGTAYAGNGSALAGRGVTADVGASRFATGTTGANGYFYLFAPPGT
ncbi:hypothetical protein, partial [Parafrigoribacterium mesophilum]|uniref:hypothetical protein n=1 Tax=Parafrigoribacterium mesophilum TaxID=433646 RepID=UPI0031FDC859